MYINSDKIKIYPVTANYSDISSDTGTLTFNESTSQYRYAETRNLEQNITSQYNNILDTKSFILCSNKNKIEDFISFENGILYINPLKFCIYGYIFEITEALKISLLNYDYTNNKTWYIYFKIELENNPIIYKETSIPNNILKGRDINNIYTGLSLEIKESADFIINEEDNKIYKLILGSVKKINQNLVFDYNKTLITKTNINTMNLSIDDLSISKEAYDNGIVENWLNNYFILDDGKIGD